MSTSIKTKLNYLSFVMTYLFYYFAFAIFSCLIAVYLLDKGFTPAQTSLVVSSSFLSSMIAQPIIGTLSDRYSLKRVNQAVFGLACLGGIYFAYASSLIACIIGYSFVLALINGSNPILEKLATLSPFKYGSIRVWGTIGYALGSQAAGLIYAWIAPRAIFFAFVISLVLSMIGLYFAKADVKKQQLLQNAKNKEKNTTSKKPFVTLFKNRLFVQYLLIAGIFFSLINIANTYIPAMFQAEGLKITTVSNILFWAVLCEVPVVFFSYLFMDRLSNKILLIIPTLIVLAQFFSFGANLWLPIQIFWTLLAKHPASMIFVMMNLKIVATLIPDDQQITALALIQTIRNLASVIAQSLFGWLLEISGYHQMFFIAFGVICCVLLLLIFYRIPKSPKHKVFS